MINHADLASFQKLRTRIFSLIKKAIEEFDGGSKSWEGKMSIEFPGYFDPNNSITILLHCYVLGVGRHQEWSGRNMQEALDKAWNDVNHWEKSDEY